MKMWLDKAVIFRWAVVAIIALSAMTWGYFIITENRPKELLLPVYGNKNGDSTYHKIAAFSLTDQYGRTVTQDNFSNKIYVSDFFFTNCPGICPIMTNQMVRIAERFKMNDNVMLLSHTVKPEEDSIPVLRKYAEDHNADGSKWLFVRGDVKLINELATTSYLVAGTEGETEEDFVHTQYFTLIDEEKRIRGFYDGTDSAEVDKLMKDIDVLLSE